MPLPARDSCLFDLEAAPNARRGGADGREPDHGRRGRGRDRRVSEVLPREHERERRALDRRLDAQRPRGALGEKRGGGPSSARATASSSEGRRATILPRRAAVNQSILPQPKQCAAFHSMEWYAWNEWNGTTTKAMCSIP